MSFLIIVCTNCGRFLLAKTEQKTRICPYCGFKIALYRAKKVASAENAYEASALLQRLKRDTFLREEKG